MSAISTDIISDKGTGSNFEARSRLFGRAVGKATFRPGLASQEFNRLEMFGSNNDFENMPERSHTISLQRRLNQTYRTTNDINKSSEVRTLGFQFRMMNDPHQLQGNGMRYNEISDETYPRSRISTVSRTFGLISEDTNRLSNGQLDQELRRSNMYSSGIQRPLGMLEDSRISHGSFLRKPSENDDVGFGHCLRRNDSMNSTLTAKKFGLQSRNLSGLYPEGSFRLNQESNLRNHNMSTNLKTFSSELQDRTRYNDLAVDDDGFRRPLLSRVIRGRNSTLSSRLLHEPRHCKDLSNISSVNVSQIPRREGDVLSESRLALNTRFNGMDNQSVSSSFVSVTSIKSQFMSVLESLHSSILNIGPRLTAEAVRKEIERAKEKLEIISERSFAASVKDAGEFSVMNHSSKYICPPISESSVTNTLDGGSLHLKPSKDLLKMLVSSKERQESEEKGSTSSFSRGKSTKDTSKVVFKKTKSKSSPEKKKANVSGSKAMNKRISKSPKLAGTPEKKNKIISTPVGKNKKMSKNSELAVSPKKKTKSVSAFSAKNKRALKSPSSSASPDKNKTVSTPTGKNKKISMSPERGRSPEKEKRNASGSRGKNKGISKSPKSVDKKSKILKVTLARHKISKSLTPVATPVKKSKRYKRKRQTKSGEEMTGTPLKGGTVSEVQTRSGRTVKPPSMFWLVTTRSNEVICVKNGTGKETKEEVKGQTRSDDDTKRQGKPPRAQSERKRKLPGDGDSVQSKKTKVEKKAKVEVEVRMEVGEGTTKKKSKSKSTAAARSLKSNKSPPSKKESKAVKKKTVKTTSESKKETEVMESEEEVELSLDDIRVPEVARLSGGPLLSRSQLRLAAMETPPLKYFNSNLRLLRSTTPAESPDWFISQRTESEARKFQKRREEAFKHTSRVDVKKKTIVEKKTTKNVQSIDLKRMMDWVAEKTVRSPQWNSKVLQYVLPSRKQMEMEAEEGDEDENVEFS